MEPDLEETSERLTGWGLKDVWLPVRRCLVFSNSCSRWKRSALRFNAA